MKASDFSKPIRQSSKGIIIIFAFNAYNFVRRFFVLFIAFGISLTKKKTFAHVTPTVIFLVIIGILIVLLVLAILKYLNFKFYLSKDDFHLSTGIINKDNIIISKSKIQNVYIKQNFLQQIINVVSLNIETAGDNKSEISIKALDKPTALKLKKELFTKSNSTETLTDVVESRNVFFRVSLKRLFLEGISQNHLRSFLIITSFVFGLYYEFKDYFRDLKLKQGLEELIHLDKESLLNIIIINTVFILVAILISLLFSVLKTVVTNFNLEVVENQKTIEINKGLFNKVSLSLTPSRIQNIVIKTNRIKRYFDLHTLSVKQAMVTVKQRKNFVIIALEKEQLKHLVDKLLVNYTSAIERSNPKGYYKRILALNMFALALIINVPGFILFGNIMWYINIALVLFSVLYVTVTYRKAFYKIDDQFLTIGSGFIDTTTNILEIHKIQAVKLKQTIFQKRIQISSVIISTASKSVKIPYVSETEAKSIYDYLLFKVESQNRDWM
ncbi:PH domain-containing protein [Psychroserpens burtonensis]|uniref:PH domain-containing protein n=1 Tax=Psychroserpens burtonensis TaxID=49278 RepID=A0A5C7BJT1_9FLAO|nr:PH domain-containing protein [Psychroserpens burtonensis]TXE20392.1 PH domain-containing protein [Psychroserpens burtonensis]